MIHFVDVLLKDIFEMGREFPWKKPDKCPCCGNWKVWGHGFVSAFFHGFCCAIIQTYHSINPFASNQCRQMAEGFLQIQTTALAEEFKTPEDGLAALEDRTITGI